MYEDQGSFKSLEDVQLKTTYNMEVNGRSFSEGETIAIFDRIQVSGLREFKNYITAHGGYDNRDLVFWQRTEKLQLTFSQGIFSSLQFGLLTNSQIIKVQQNEPILVSKFEELESNELGNIRTSKEPVDQIFVYEKATGEKLTFYKLGDFLRISKPYTDVVVFYRYNYLGGGSVAKIGQQFLNGFLELEGKTRVKDDTSGLITTGIIKIPKLKLMSGLSIQLGAQANPVVGNFSAEGVPVESRHNSYVMEFRFLNNDIDSDM